MAPAPQLDTLDIPRAPWAEVAPEFVASWEQGQHVILFGRTGRGKTTLGLELCRLAIQWRNANVVALGTKARDKTLRDTGWPIVREWPPTYQQRQTQHVVYWPPYTVPSRARSVTRGRVAAGLDEIMTEGGWRLFVDEMAYLVETLGLRHVLDEFWNGARSSGISLIAASQRPAWVSRSGVSQAEWGISFAINDLDDRTRVAEIFGDRDRYRHALAQLGPHEFLMVEALTQRAVVSQLDLRA